MADSPSIPASPYPVLSDSRKPAREIWGPYIASKPAYQIFADMAKNGGSISDYIAADMQSQAKAEGRVDPVTEHPENRQFWFHDGEMEPLPVWKNPNDAPAQSPAPTTPAAPQAPKAPPLPVGPAAGPAPSIFVDPPPAPAIGRDPAPSAQPADPGDSTQVASASTRQFSRRAPAAAPASPVASAVQRRMATASYARPPKQTRLAERAATRQSGTRAV